MADNVNSVLTSSAASTIQRLGNGTFGPGAQVLADYLYDTVTLTTGQTKLDFFSVPVGQNGKTLADTNLSLPGQLPRGQAFEVHAIDFRILRNSGTLNTAAIQAIFDTIAGSAWRHYFPGSDFWLRHPGAVMLPKIPAQYEIGAGDISSVASFQNDFGLSIKEIPQVIGEQVSFGLETFLATPIPAALNNFKVQCIYRTNLVKRT